MTTVSPRALAVSFKKNSRNDFSSDKNPPLYTLSRYFPPDTLYFYSFPAGEESGFFNSVPPWIEELVGGRPLLCAGENVKVITFSSVYNTNILKLRAEMGVLAPHASRVIVMPSEINSHLMGKDRNEKVKLVIKALNLKKRLVMAQPFLDNDLRDMYQISPELTVWLNDKENLRYYIPARHLPAQYAYFLNGKAFASSSSSYPFPCVVKMTSSSAGDGVRICRTAEEFENAKAVFKNLSGPVMVCEFIHAVRNLGVQFGIPADPAKEIDIIGFNEQIIGKHGEYLGGMIPPDFDKPELQDLFALIKESILPKVRAKGWYGVGGLDVLVTEKGKYYFIDPNFRMTAAFVFICQVRNKQIQKSLLGFIGRFKGTEAELREKILPIAQFGTIQQLLNILSISYKDGIFCFNGALVFDKNVSKEKVAQKLLELGIESPVLVSLASS